jgi:hypothetical protein
MVQTLHNLVESIQAHPGRAPSCAWVEERLPAYHDWDLPEHELGAVERHLAHCPACKRACKEVETLVDSIREELSTLGSHLRHRQPSTLGSLHLGVTPTP